MAVSRAPGTKGTRVDDDVTIARGHYGDTGIGEKLRRARRRRRGLGCEYLRTEPPPRLFIHVVPGSEPLRPIQNNTAGRQSGAAELIARSIGMKEAAGIVIPDERQFVLRPKNGV